VTLAPSNLALARRRGLPGPLPVAKSRSLARSAMVSRRGSSLRSMSGRTVHRRGPRQRARGERPAKYAGPNRAQTRSSAASGASRRRSRRAPRKRGMARSATSDAQPTGHAERQ